MESNDPLTLITETWMTSHIDFTTIILTAGITLAVLVAAVILAYENWHTGAPPQEERKRLRLLKALGLSLAALTVAGYAFVALPLSLQKQQEEHSGQYVFANAPLANADVIDEQGFGTSRQIGVWVEGADYVLMLTGDDGLGFLQHEKGSPVHLYCDPKPQGTSLRCSTTSHVDEKRMATEGVYDYQSTQEAFAAQG